MVRKQIFYAVLIAVTLWTAGKTAQNGTVPALSHQGTIEPVIVIDAGHGGEDGGAVSLSGTPESQINLSVACKLDEILTFYGIQTRMTRTQDISLHDSEATTLREKKVSDLRNRVGYIQSIQNPILVSIHQNSYQDSRYRGAQVFFSSTPGSDTLANQVQTTLNTSLNLQNTRKPQKIPDTVYLMNHIDCPAILVECGFLTNPEEEALLKQEHYQKKLSLCIASSLLTAQNPYHQI